MSTHSPCLEDSASAFVACAAVPGGILSFQGTSICPCGACCAAIVADARTALDNTSAVVKRFISSSCRGSSPFLQRFERWGLSIIPANDPAHTPRLLRGLHHTGRHVHRP